MSEDFDHFEVRIGRSRKATGGGRLGKHSNPSATASMRGPSAPAAPRAIKAHFRKGHNGGASRGSAASYRVMVKARFIDHARRPGGNLKAHVAYLARDFRRSQRGEPGQQPGDLERQTVAMETGFYSGSDEPVAPREHASDWSSDRRHFRLIISPEHGAALGDLRPFVKEVMSDLEQRLGTRLDWFAIDHWDTANPHAHVLIRGRRADGTDLIIPRRIVAFELRARAETILSRALGQAKALGKDVSLTSNLTHRGAIVTDREITALASAQRVSTSDLKRPDIVLRLVQLERWGLAAQHGRGQWVISTNLVDELSAVEERDRAREELRKFGLGGFSNRLKAATSDSVTIGQLVHFAATDPLTGRSLLVIEAADGTIRHAALTLRDDAAALGGAAPGALVELQPRVERRLPGDRVIAEVARRAGGIYSSSVHLSQDPAVDPQLIDANVRRLEALRRVGVVTGESTSGFVIPEQFLERTLAHERSRQSGAPLAPRVLSWLPLGEQIEAEGFTYLDRILAHETRAPAGAGPLGTAIARSLDLRRSTLRSRGYLGTDRNSLASTEVAQLLRRELQMMAANLSEELGVPVRTDPPHGLTGIYVRRMDLAQGRMALVIGSDAAALVPWRATFERFVGRSVEISMRANNPSLGLARG